MSQKKERSTWIDFEIFTPEFGDSIFYRAPLGATSGIYKGVAVDKENVGLVLNANGHLDVFDQWRKGDAAKKIRREVYLSDEDVAVAHQKAGLPIVSGPNGNRNKAILYCINAAPSKKSKTPNRHPLP